MARRITSQARSITCLKGVFVLVIQHVVRVRHTVICGLAGSTVFFFYIINGTILERKKRY
jgi:hypothetical protein